MADQPLKTGDKASEVVPFWVEENPVLSDVPLIGPMIAKSKSGLTSMSVDANGAVVEEYAHRPDGLKKIQTNTDGLVRSDYDPFVRSDGLLKRETLWTEYGYEIREYDSSLSQTGLQRYETRFGKNGWYKESFDKARRDDGLIEIVQDENRLTERFDPAKAKEKGLTEHSYDFGVSESWKYEPRSKPDGLVQETRFKHPFGYEKRFAGRSDGLLSETWNKEQKDDHGSAITIREYSNGRIKKLHDWEL